MEDHNLIRNQLQATRSTHTDEFYVFTLKMGNALMLSLGTLSPKNNFDPCHYVACTPHRNHRWILLDRFSSNYLL